MQLLCRRNQVFVLEFRVTSSGWLSSLRITYRLYRHHRGRGPSKILRSCSSSCPTIVVRDMLRDGSETHASFPPYLAALGLYMVCFGPQ